LWRWYSADAAIALHSFLFGQSSENTTSNRLESLQQLVGSFPEGHHTRTLLEELHLERALGAVEEDIGALRDSLLYPRGT
jgi:hypothetical protein